MAIISISDSQINSANGVLVADASSKIPAKDGSQITVLNATNISSGTIATARLDSGTTAGKLVVLDGSGNLPAVDASLLTGIVSATISASDPTISTNPSGGVGTEWNNSTSGEMYICTDATAGENVWKNVGAGTGDVVPPVWYGTRGVYAGGLPASGYSNVMDYVTIATTGNAVDFGNLISARAYTAGSSDGTRGLFAGGYQSSPPVVNFIDYITVASVGNATDFGDLTLARSAAGAVSNGTRSVTGGGKWIDGGNARASNVIDYVAFSTLGNAVDFGDLTVSRFGCGGVSNGTRGVYSGGEYPDPSTNTNVMDYMTIATPGNAIDFGDLTITKAHSGTFSSRTRGIIGGGASWWGAESVEYITIATTGNATDFGDTTQAREGPGGFSDASRGVFGGGYAASPEAKVNTIDYITIATPGNATDFGDLTVIRYTAGGLSGT